MAPPHVQSNQTRLACFVGRAHAAGTHVAERAGLDEDGDTGRLRLLAVLPRRRQRRRRLRHRRGGRGWRRVLLMRRLCYLHFLRTAPAEQHARSACQGLASHRLVRRSRGRRGARCCLRTAQRQTQKIVQAPEPNHGGAEYLGGAVLTAGQLKRTRTAGLAALVAKSVRGAANDRGCYIAVQISGGPLCRPCHGGGPPKGAVWRSVHSDANNCASCCPLTLRVRPRRKLASKPCPDVHEARSSSESSRTTTFGF